MAQQGNYPIGNRVLAPTDTLTGVVTNATANVPVNMLSVYVQQHLSSVAITGGTIMGVSISGSPISGSTGSFTSLTAGTISGDGSGLTGTASALNIGGTAALATNLAGGAANQIPYQTGANATSYAVAPTTANTVLTWSGSAFMWSTPGSGTVTSVNVSGGTTGLTTSGGPITSSGTITLSGTLAVANGGTGVTTSTGTGSTVLSASPTLTGAPLAPTAAARTDTTQLATTAFANGVSGSYSLQSVVTSSTTFTSSSIGAAIDVNSASATANILPAASVFPNGKAISFSNIGAGIATFTRAGSDTITGGNLSAATAIPLNQGECVTLVSDGSSKWYVAASNVTFFGAPRSWQDVSASRTFGTSYVNSTGRDIVVEAGCTGFSSTGVITLNINGLAMYVSPSVAGNSFSPTTLGIVPNGSSYSLSQGSGSAPVIWRELR